MSKRDELRELLKDGEVLGTWSPSQVARFERRCSEFIGQHGDALLAVVDAAEKYLDPGPCTRFVRGIRLDALRAAVARVTEGSAGTENLGRRPLDDGSQRPDARNVGAKGDAPHLDSTDKGNERLRDQVIDADGRVIPLEWVNFTTVDSEVTVEEPDLSGAAVTRSDSAEEAQRVFDLVRKHEASLPRSDFSRWVVVDMSQPYADVAEEERA